MNKPTKYAMIGAGGIGCALTPLLTRLGDVVIIDADSYEQKNVERQFPALHGTENKAKMLAELLAPHTLNKVDWIGEYVKDAMITANEKWHGIDMIISGVDNNESRAILVDLADSLDLPLILAGNAHETGEAHLFVPGIYDPMEEHDFPIEPHQAPWGCNRDSVVEQYPQTPIANALAAAASMHILLSWIKASKPSNIICYSRLDPFSAEVKRIRDYVD